MNPLRRILCTTLVGLGTLLSACDRPPASTSQPQNPPVDKPSPPQTQPAEKPEPPPPPPPSATTQPAEEPWTSCLQLLKPRDEGAPMQVAVVEGAGRRLELATDNVQFLRIVREELPLETDRSLVLVLDEQPFEWRADSEIRTFARSENGVWSPFQTRKPRDQQQRP